MRELPRALRAARSSGNSAETDSLQRSQRLRSKIAEGEGKDLASPKKSAAASQSNARFVVFPLQCEESAFQGCEPNAPEGCIENERQS